jgi:trigger factor
MGHSGRHGIVAVVPGALKTTVTELAESRVRVQVEVPADEVESRIEQHARKLGRQLKLPGFRKGKVPAPLVLQRIGREAVLDEAVRDSLASWYSDAIAQAGIVPVGDPQVDLGDLPPQGEALGFSIEIGVLPKAELGEYRGLEVARREPQAADELIQQEVDAMRERLARLDTVERAAGEGDFVVVDYIGYLSPEDPSSGEDAQPFEGGEGRDQLVELGGGNLIPGFEEGLLSSAAGETRTVELTFPADYGAEHLAGKNASFEIAVKEVKDKRLPEVDEDFAIDAGFDSVEELREDIRGRLLEAEEQKIADEFREAALDAAVAQAQVPVTPALTDARAKEMWERMLHSLSHRGISREVYLQVAAREEAEILTDMLPDAEQALRREAVVTAIVAAEGIVPSEEDLLVAMAPVAEREGVEPEKLLEDLKSAGRVEEVREDLAARQAVELVAEHAKPISVEQASAREQLWTPEQGGAQEGGEPATAEPAGLWTPDR